jgi:poly-beta-hydroxyalkanoate depolymerase
MNTEQQGPFSIERHEPFVMVRSHEPFRAKLIVQLPPAKPDTGSYVLPAFALSPGMELVLSCDGHDDVVISGGLDD